MTRRAWNSAFLAVALLALVAPVSSGAATLAPVHGVIVSLLPGSRAIVRTDSVPLTVDAQTRVYRLDSSAPLRTGEEIDAFLDRSSNPWRLTDTVQAPPLINNGISHVHAMPLAVGDAFPDLTFIDERGQRVAWHDLRGKALMVSFIFTRCADSNVCPVISGKYAYLQRHIDPQAIHLVEITLDPTFDSPAVLGMYARNFNLDPARWSILTGHANDITRLLASFHLSSFEDRPGNFVHDDALIIVDPRGRITTITPSASWFADDALALTRDAAGLSSNPLRRFAATAFTSVANFCGGSMSIANVMLDSIVFLLGVIILGTPLIFLARHLWLDGRRAKKT
jgi:protein SCO1/2